MVSGKEYVFSDTTEASNITSLQSDTSCISNSHIKNTVCDSAMKEDDNFQQCNCKGKDCKWHDTHSVKRRGTSPEEYVISARIGDSHKKDPSKDQSSKQQVQSTAPCLCRVRNM